MPSELPNCQCGVRESRFVVFVRCTRPLNAKGRLTMDFGHSEGTFTLRKFLVYFVKVPSELRNSQNLTRQGRFVVYSHTRERKAVNDGIWPFRGHFYTKKIFSLFMQNALGIAKLSKLDRLGPFCRLLPHTRTKSGK